MKYTKHLEQLKSIPADEKKYNLKELIQQTERLKKDSMAIEIGIATEIGLLYAFNKFNINDSIMEGFEKQYPNLAEDKSLYEALAEKGGADISDASMMGYTNGIKGKIYEMEVESRLNEQYEGWNFSISENPTQTVWDLKGVNSDGEEILIQAKMGDSNYANEVQERMLDNPDVLFATSTEIQDKILEGSPELSSQFVDVNISNTEFTAEVSSDLEQLISAHGVDIPDSIGELLPIAGEIMMGITLLRERSKVKHEYQNIDDSDADKIKMLKTIMVISRFGVTSVLATCGGAVGTAVFPVVGSLCGGIGGALAGAWVNSEIKPHMYDFSLGIMDLSQDDLFYFKNKSDIDGIGERLSITYNSLN